MKKIFISFLVIISVVLLADFFSIVNLNYSYVGFISIIIFAGLLIYKLIDFLFFKKSTEVKVGVIIKKEKPVIRKNKIKKANENDLKKKNYIQKLKETKEEKKVQDLEKWRAKNKKEKEQHKSNVASDYTLKIKRKEELSLRKIQQKEDKIKLRRLEKERLIKEEEKNNLQNIKSATKEKNEKEDEKLSWLEQQEKKLKLRQLETDNFLNNLDRLKGLAKNGKQQITELKRAEDKPKKDKQDTSKSENKVVKKSAPKKVIKPVDDDIIKTPKNKELEQLNALKEKSVSKKVIKTVKPVVKRKPLTEKAANTANIAKRVNYSTDRIITSTAQYPVIRKPQQKSIIRSFRLGRNNRKGYKEEAFYAAIKKRFYNDFNVLDNAMLAIGEGTNPYEPDIAMISKGKKNIYIDIEIDEPYSGVSRKLTHCYPEDINRDNYFVNRGWFVIRFSEYQVHHQIEECLREIVKVIAAIHINFNVGSLSSFKSIDKINCWDTIQARHWELINYRENYLNHTFKPYTEEKEEIDTALTLEEKLEEYKVKPTAFVEIPKTKVKDVPAKKIVTESKAIKPIIPPPKKEYNSSNNSVQYLIEFAVNKGFPIEMKYTNWNRESSLRRVSKLEFTTDFLKDGYEFKDHFSGFCHKRQEKISFKVSRINYMKILN